MNKILIPVAITAVLLSACQNIQVEDSNDAETDIVIASGDSEVKDGAPAFKLDPRTIYDAQPRQEVITNIGNKSPYEVYGQTYTVMPDYRGYKAKGTASWYGTKFDGRKTSNGEVFSLYGMTAAHKTLPIPVYVKVKNLDNGKTAVVRVNDRGPFVKDRLIDLSYAAAVKLGFADVGTAPVEISVIDTDNTVYITDTLVAQEYYVQLAAFGSREAAEELHAELARTVAFPAVIVQKAEEPDLHRVRLGPYGTEGEAQEVKKAITHLRGGTPYIVKEAVVAK